MTMPKKSDIPHLPVAELADAAMAVTVAGLKAPSGV